MKTLLCGIFIFIALCAASVDLPRKQMAGPPSEFASKALPTPLAASLVENSAFIWMSFKKSSTLSKTVEWTRKLDVDSEEVFSFTVFLPNEDHYTFTLTDPSGKDVDLAPHATETYFPIGDERIPGTNYLFKGDIKKGIWKFHVISKVQYQHEKIPAGAIILYNDSPVKIHSHLNTYSLKLGNKIGVVSRLTDDKIISSEYAPSALKGVVSEAYMEIVLPDGSETEVPMTDDGLNSDGFPDDGIFGGSIAAEEVGLYAVTATLRGKKSDGSSFERTTQHIIPVVANEVSFTGFAYSEIAQNSRINIHVEVNLDKSYSTLDRLFRGFAEVWGVDKNGKEIPICWLSSMVDVIKHQNTHIVTLEMDPKWLTKAGAKGPFVLKNVFLQDAYVYVPVTQMSSIPVKSTPQVETLLSSIQFNPNLEITREMRVGIRPLGMERKNVTSGTPTLLLSHGYCASDNPWKSAESNSFKWDGAAFFEDVKANLPNEQFAEKVVNFAKSHEMDTFSMIGHSQGGVVALHLLNYYWSPLDNAKDGRLIQTVGTPWKGNSGAGSAANLVKIFGYGCGANEDLTTDGSNLWLSGIDHINRNEVHYYTTTYKQGTLFGDYCNLAVNLVLQWPNDGTAELDLSQLEGGKNEGNKEKWCHTTDMGYPAQYFDESRNKILNTNAAR